MNRRFPRFAAPAIASVTALAYFLSCAYLIAQESPSVAAAQEKTDQTTDTKKDGSKTQYLRVLRDMNKKPIALETSIVRFVPDGGEGDFVVDLVGVVHIGDGLYYEKLNQRFEEYDVVLYEMVAPKGLERPKKGRRSDNPLALMQSMMTVGLGLELQTHRIDYTKKNFVHADMSPEEMAEAMKKRGDNIFTVGLGALADMIRQYNLRKTKLEEKGVDLQDQVESFDPLSLLLDSDGPQKLKRAMAEEFESQGVAEGGGLGQTLNTLLIDDRNGACMKVLAEQKAAGKRKIAIFYGAAHMPDFQKRLEDQYQLKRQGVTWLTAWDLERRGGGLLQLLEPK